MNPYMQIAIEAADADDPGSAGRKEIAIAKGVLGMNGKGTVSAEFWKFSPLTKSDVLL